MYPVGLQRGRSTLHTPAMDFYRVFVCLPLSNTSPERSTCCPIYFDDASQILDYYLKRLSDNNNYPSIRIRSYLRNVLQYLSTKQCPHPISNRTLLIPSNTTSPNAQHINRNPSYSFAYFHPHNQTLSTGPLRSFHLEHSYANDQDRSDVSKRKERTKRIAFRSTRHRTRKAPLLDTR